MATTSELHEQAGKLSAHDAEVFCGKNHIEYHPLVCDIVTKRDNPDDPGAHCTHVSKAARAAAEATLEVPKKPEVSPETSPEASPGG